MYKHLFTRSFEEEIESSIRVNHAGEFGAVRIYQAQNTCLPNNHLINEILNCEVIHFEYFKNITNRETIFMPIWHNLSYFLGLITATHSLQMAMLYTHAVESVVERHYIKQIEYLEKIQAFYNTSGLLIKIKQFLHDEQEHGDIGMKNERSNAILFKIFCAITQVSISLSEIT